MQNNEAHREFNQGLAMHEHEAEGPEAAFQNTNMMIMDEVAEPKNQRIHDNITLEGGETRVPASCPREAIDFMGTSVSHNVSTGTAKSKFECSPNLDLCLTRYNPSGTSGSNCNFDQATIARAVTERKEEDDILHNADAHRSIQREAALNKFRLKRKDRCYEKKVRYESRKKLAEQRPRVKGQFVRQVAPQAEETKQHRDNSIEG